MRTIYETRGNNFGLSASTARDVSLASLGVGLMLAFIALVILCKCKRRSNRRTTDVQELRPPVQAS
jgi:hypothetical protein